MFSFISQLLGLGEKVAQVSTQELQGLLSKKDTVVIDVRTPSEFAQGHIPGARLINLYDAAFGEKIAQLDKSKNYYINCRSGNRSAMACRKMQKLGFENVWNVSGGIMAWKGKLKK